MPVRDASLIKLTKVKSPYLWVALFHGLESLPNTKEKANQARTFVIPCSCSVGLQHDLLAL